MIDTTASDVAARFYDFLAKVQKGESVRITDQGRPVARIIPDVVFMPGSVAAEVFRQSLPDPETADAISAELQKLRAESEDALAHRH